jgi:hypothetical protein
MAGRVVVSTLNNDTGPLATQNGMTGIAKAWCNFNGSTSTITDSFNVSSVTVLGTGVYRYNFTTAMPNSNFATALGTARDSGTGFSLQGLIDQNNPQSTANVTITIGAGSTPLNVARACISVFSS